MSDYFDDDIDDDLLFEITDQDILDPSNRTSLTHPKPELKKPKQKSILDFQQPLLRMDTVNPHNPISKPSYHEINESTIKKWIYPINYPIRDYQFNICRTAMFKNTLVCLPTGLGKTFIAAVIMYNYYRWFPEGKIVFLAPTKPLVNQQIEACFKITGIPRSDVVELTGTVQASVRKLEYKTKRLLFMTPETFRNDICSGDCPYKQVVMIVFDEAHRATGNYAYCDIVRELQTREAIVRILALSATPGSDSKRVQAVVDNLLIERIEMRAEESPDVQRYVFKRNIEEHVVPLGDQVTLVQDKFAGLLKPYLKFLVQNGCYSYENPMQASSFGLMQRRDTWRAKYRNTMAKPLQMKIEAFFGILISLVSMMQTLVNSGIKCFYNSLVEFCQEVKQKANPSKTRLEFVNNQRLANLLKEIKDRIELPSFSSHPKLDKMVSIVMDHFAAHEEYVKECMAKGEAVDSQTKIMVFSSHRASVEEIVSVLQKHRPLVRATAFIGQASSKKAVGLKQKQQLQVIEDYMNGLFNVLVSTSIGEEGLDIGEIDLIICFDVSKSPIRLLQRQGRTGRKRIGNICLLLNEGADENAVKNARTQYKSIQKAIIDGRKLQFYDGSLAGIIPCIYTPECEQVNIDVPKEDQRPIKKQAKNSKKNGPFLPDGQEKQYQELFFKNYTKSEPMAVNKHLDWQTQALSHLSVPHSAISDTYISLMEYFAELRQEQGVRILKSPCVSIKSDPVPASQNSPKPKPSNKKKAVFTIIKDSDSDSESFLEGISKSRSETSLAKPFVDSDPFSDVEVVDVESKLKPSVDFNARKQDTWTKQSSYQKTVRSEKSDSIKEPVQAEKSKFQQLLPSSLKEFSRDPLSEMIFNSPKKPLPKPLRKPVELESPKLYHRENDVDEPCDLFTMDQSIHFKPGDNLVSPSIDEFIESPVLDQVSPFGEKMLQVSNIQDRSIEIIGERNLIQDDTFAYSDFDEMDFNAIAELEKGFDSPNFETPAKNINSTQSDASSIRIVRRGNRIVVHSSSPYLDTIQKKPIHVASPDDNRGGQVNRIEQLRLKLQQKQSFKRSAPRNRAPLTPTALTRPTAKVSPKKRSKKNFLAKEFVEFEAVVSGESCSSDEDTEPDRDLSGFVVGSTGTSPMDTSIGFYRQSLLSPNQGGFGKVVGSKYRLAPITYTKNVHLQEDEDAESLVDFIVNDSQVEFESGVVDSFLDESQSIEKPSIIEIRSKDPSMVLEKESEIDYIDNDIDLDTMDLDDLVDFE